MSLLPAIRKPFRYTFCNAALALIGVNLAVYLLALFWPKLAGYLALNPFLCVYRRFYWQVFTYQFVHGGFMHLFSNMVGLLFFGTAVERRLGSREFLLAYLLSGAVCGIISLAIYALTGAWLVVLLGASGAVFAILLLYATFFPRSTIFLWGIIPIPAPILVIGYAVLETAYMAFRMRDGVAHSTHLIGFAAAWAYSLARFGINPWREWFPRR